MSEQKKKAKDQIKSPNTSKTSENTAPPSTKQPATESYSTTKKQGRAQSDPTGTTTPGKADQLEDVDLSDPPSVFEDVDLSDPPPDEPSFEMVERKDAPHSSYNSHQDHKWKYPEGFGKDKKDGVDGDGKGWK